MAYVFSLLFVALAAVMVAGTAHSLIDSAHMIDAATASIGR
jgi:hypothetical protein